LEDNIRHNIHPGELETGRDPESAGLPQAKAYALLNPKRGAGLGCITLVAIFFIAVTSYGLAYQTRPSYKVDVGDRLDRPFVSSFNTREPGENTRISTTTPWDGLSYRWSGSESKVDFPGIGSQPLTVTIRYNTSANINNPVLTVVINDQHPVTLPAPPKDSWAEQSFFVPGEWFRNGHLHLKLKTTTFRPAGDPRDLGVAVDWVKVDPAELDKQAFIRPPDGDFLPLVFTAVLGVLIFISIGVPAVWALVGGGVIVAGLSYWLINDRLNLTTLMEQDFIRILFFMWVVAYLAAEFIPRLFQKLGVPTTRNEGAILALLFLMQFVILYFFQLHPQFISSDVGLNIHRLQSVIDGRWVFTEGLPNNRGAAPYPPGLYFFLWPFTILSGLKDQAVGNLIQLANSILAATGVFMVFYLASLLRLPAYHLAPRKDSPLRLSLVPTLQTGTNWAALIAAAFYAINRFQFQIFSQGNHANLFGVWTFLLFLCVITGTLDYMRHISRRQITALPVNTAPITGPGGDGAATGADTTHLNQSGPSDTENSDDTDPFGLGQLSRSGSTTPSALTRFFMRQTGRWNKQVWPRLVVALRYLLPVACLLLVFLSHYGTFLFTNVFMVLYIGVISLLGGKVARRDVFYLAGCWLIALILAFILYYYNHVGLILTQFTGGMGASSGGDSKPSFDLFQTLRRIYTDSREWFGMVVLLATLGGIALWVSRRWLGKNEILQKNLERPWQLGPVGGALLALGLTGLAFALAEGAQGIESRYQLYIIVALVIMAGRFLGRLWRIGLPGMVVVLALFAFQFLHALIFWLERVTYYFL
jgi:hypothetical protein